jgi:hypothetical protein
MVQQEVSVHGCLSGIVIRQCYDSVEHKCCIVTSILCQTLRRFLISGSRQLPWMVQQEVSAHGYSKFQVSCSIDM